tara:strand:- start:91 stop:804 length:714 start_codon:yes stop_codon:yes gene_type:complete
MAVSADTVYQRVLALLNKEQRGYMTAIEYNLLANQAQLYIFEKYFSDLNRLERNPGNNYQYADPVETIKEKISVFEVRDAAVVNGTTLPSDVYKLGMIMYNNIEAQYISQRDFRNLNAVPILRPQDRFPYYTRDGIDIQVFGNDANGDFERKLGNGVTCNYLKKPREVIWNYVLLPSAQGEYPLYNANTSQDFELHHSEETHLVDKILEFAGILINKPGIVQIAEQEQAQKIQQQNS